MDSSITGLVMSLEFMRKNKFKKKKLEKLIYMRNVNSTFNYKKWIKHIIEVELFYRRHKKRKEINIIRR